MDILSAVIAGLVGTVVITILMYAGPMMGMPRMDIIGLIGSMFTTSPGAKNVIGVIGHFALGTIFALIYAAIWAAGFGQPTWLWGLGFGLVHGLIVAFVGMPIMMRIHPRAPEMEGGARALIGTLMGHLVFGLVVALVFSGVAVA